MKLLRTIRTLLDKGRVPGGTPVASITASRAAIDRRRDAPVRADRQEARRALAQGDHLARRLEAGRTWRCIRGVQPRAGDELATVGRGGLDAHPQFAGGRLRAGALVRLELHRVATGTDQAGLHRVSPQARPVGHGA
jgi:hypothetical protein